MALVKKQSQSARTILIVLGLAGLLLVGYFVFSRYVLKPGSNTNESGTGSDDEQIIKVDPSILRDERVRNLRSYRKSIQANVNEAGQPFPFQ